MHLSQPQKKRIGLFLNRIRSSILFPLSFCICLILVLILLRVFFIDQFVIPSNSMAPTLIKGDRVWVNKTLFGARIYQNLDSINSSTLYSWRTRGLRDIKRNDIIVFNYPLNKKQISFKINYTYIKRCIALPGDSIWAQNGYYKNSRYDQPLGYIPAQDELNQFDETNIPEKVKYTIPRSFEEYPWTIKNFGPIYVPRKGDVMMLTPESLLFYSEILEFETNKEIELSTSGQVLANKEPIKYHIFKNNYYFSAGDNILDSRDSRYWGFIPESYIVGIATFIPYSIKDNTNQIRWNRLFKRLSYNEMN